MRREIQLLNVNQGYTALLNMWRDVIKPALQEGKRLHLAVRTETRTIAQNSLMWSMLTDLSKQVKFAVDGKMQYIEPEDVKDILTACLTKHQRVAAGIDGGFVMLGQRTRKMTIGEMGDLITLGHAYGIQHNVKWSRTSVGREVPDEVCA